MLSPEEEFALTQGEQGVPQSTYETSAAAQEAILRAADVLGDADDATSGTTASWVAEGQSVDEGGRDQARRASSSPREERCNRRA